MPDPNQPNPAAANGSTSRSLLVDLQRDRPAAWNRLVSLYAPLVYHWCRKTGLAEQDMADIFQQVFQSVARHIGSFRKDQPSDSFRGWLRTITRNKVRDHFRRTRRQPQATGGTDAQIRFAQLSDPLSWLDDESDAVEPAEQPEESDQLLQSALQLIRAQVHPNTWQAFWKVVVDGKTPADVGEELSMRPGTVRVAKSRVLARLREELGDPAAYQSSEPPPSEIGQDD